MAVGRVIQKAAILLFVCSFSSFLFGCGEQTEYQIEQPIATEQITEVYISSTPTPEPTPTPTPVPTQVPTPSPEPTPEPTPIPVQIPTIESTVNLPGWIIGSQVNVRQYPGTKYDILTTLDKGKYLTILGYNDSWTKVNVDGQVGYVASQYVSSTEPVAEATASNETISPEGDHIMTFSGDYTQSTSSNTSYIQSRIIDLTNAQRAAYGLSPLSYDSNLQYTANVRASELATLFSHTRPDGSDCFSAFPAGYFSIGENLATCNNVISDDEFASECVNWWMQSEGHRANILNANFNRIAVGVYISGNNMYSVQSFGG